MAVFVCLASGKLNCNHIVALLKEDGGCIEIIDYAFDSDSNMYREQ